MEHDLGVAQSMIVSVDEVLTDLTGRLAGLRQLAMETKDFSALDELKGRIVDAGVEVRMSKANVELIPGPRFDPARLPQ